MLGTPAGAPPRLVFGLTATPAVALLVPAARQETLRSLDDLAGTTVGVPAPGTPSEFMLLALLARAGIRIPRVTVKSYGERGLAGALESGQVAAGMLGDPYATRLIEDGKAVLQQPVVLGLPPRTVTSEHPQGWDLAANIVINLAQVPIPKPGLYRFEILIDDQQVRTLPFRAVRPPRTES